VVEVEVDDDDDNEDTDDDDDEEQVEEVKTPPKNNKKSPSNTKKNPTPSTPKQSTTPGSATKKTPGSAPKNKVSYIQMVHDAIIAMKDRTGSSQIAILKYILAHNPDIDNPRLKQRLLLTLKAGVSSNRLQKIKASYKINPAFTKKNKIAKAKLKAKAKVKAKQPPKVKKISKAELAALKEKQEKERKEKERQERIRKRKFPMDDMDLIQEDKELGVHISLPSRPSLPLVMPAFSTACKSDTNLQGLLEDVLHVYHFFRGDVGWGLLASKSNSNSKQAAPLVVAPFTLSHWIHAVQQVLNGNAKKSRMVPPLFSHLFCVVLQHLLVQVDIPKLTVGLASSSWSEILLLYMDAMERYHTTEASKMESVLPPNPIDVEYLLGATDEPKEDWNVDETNTQGPSYLTGVMVKAHAKLLLQDPWLLSAEELLALLRALCDDLLANSPVMEEELDVRLVEVHELLKKKRAADARFRKLQTTMNREAAEEAKQEKSDDGPVRPTRSSATLKTITTAQLETAKKQQQRANDVYDKAVRTRQVRTESVGEDRQFHAAYHFANDPSLILVQQRGGLAKPTENWNVPIDFRTYKTSWHAIDKKSLLDSYLDSLDVRGKREGVLHEALTPVRRFLHDDIKELADRKARLREKKDLIRQLENAKIKAEVGRKSGRLAGRTEEELTALQQEIDDLAGTMEGKVEAPINYEYETGLIMLRQFDSDGAGGSRRRATRRDTKQQQEEQQEETLPKMPCSKLVSTGNIDGTGVVGVIVADMLELEERAQVLCDWEKKDRKAWVAALETLVHSWHIASPPVLESESTTPESPKEDTSRMSIGSAVGSDAKRKKVEDAPSTVPQTLSNLRVRTVPYRTKKMGASNFALSGISHLILCLFCISTATSARIGRTFV
jgi:histone H1/5